ncbi:hypothetical protein BJ996_007635 [Streptomyces phaeogriseichromatogenes]|nr:hypothetical protein [Streptomyces murinus]
MMTGDMFALFVCFNCQEPFTQCPECVNTIRIDPVTELPPDAVRDEVTGNLRHNPTPNPEGFARSVKQPVCDACVEARNMVYLEGRPEGEHIAGMWERAEDRHRRAHA